MFAVALVATSAARVAAQDAIGTVLIVRVQRDTGVVARIRAELEANDFRVREVGPDTVSARAALPALATSAGARAALRMQSSRSAIELWVASEGGAAGGGEIVRLAEGERDDALLAVRATEAMRARGMRLTRRPEAPGGGSVAASGGPDGRGTPNSGSGSATPAAVSSEGASEREAAERARKQAEEERKAAERAQAEANKQAEAQREAEQRADEERKAEETREAEQRAEAEREAAAEAEAQREAEREAEAAEEAESDAQVAHARDTSLLFVEAGAAAAASPNSAAASVEWGVWLNARLQPSDDWSISALAYLPFAGGAIHSQTADAHLRTFFAGGTFDLHAALSGADLSAGAGGAFVYTHMAADDEGMLSLVKRTDDQFTAAALLRGGLSVSLSPGVRLSTRLLFGLAVPKLVVAFARQSVAEWGWPFGIVTLGIDIGLPAPLRPE